MKSPLLGPAPACAPVQASKPPLRPPGVGRGDQLEPLASENQVLLTVGTLSESNGLIANTSNRHSKQLLRCTSWTAGCLAPCPCVVSGQQGKGRRSRANNGHAVAGDRASIFHPPPGTMAPVALVQCVPVPLTLSSQYAKCSLPEQD